MTLALPPLSLIAQAACSLPVSRPASAIVPFGPDWVMRSYRGLPSPPNAGSSQS